MTVDAGIVGWLKNGAEYASSTDGAFATAWDVEAVETEIVSPLALAADAATEAALQQAFLEGPLAVEKHDVTGLRSDLVGQCITITISALGYDAGLAVFVIAAEESASVKRTTLTVLRKLT